MEKTLINHPKLHVTIKTGSEGPRHDPYSYEEYHVKTPDIAFVVHLGLAVYVDVGKERTQGDYDKTFAWADELFLKHTGYRVEQLERFHNKAKSHCPKGGRHELETMRGYPGETFECCRKCSKYVDSYFCVEAVM